MKAIEESVIMLMPIPTAAIAIRPAPSPQVPKAEKTFIYLPPQVGTVFLWESFLRPEVPANAAQEERVSLSFNYG